MGTGLHGVNGLHPLASLHILNVYVIPVLLYGTEVLIWNQSRMEGMERFFKRILRQILSLSTRVATPAIYVLANQLPVEALIHQRILLFLGGLLRDTESIEHRIGKRQVVLRGQNDKSWFSQAKRLLAHYELPSIHDLFNQSPPKRKWTSTVQAAIRDYWTNRLIKEKATYPSLKYIGLTPFLNKTPHHIWTTVESNLFDNKRATIKVKLLTGTYLLMKNRAKFSNCSALCPLCSEEDEDIVHFLVKCETNKKLRSDFLDKISDALDSQDAMKDEQTTVQLILDPSALLEDLASIKLIEKITRHMCWALHSRRMLLLSEIDEKGKSNSRSTKHAN